MSSSYAVTASFMSGPFTCASVDNCTLAFQTTGAIWADDLQVKYFGPTSARSGTIGHSSATSLSTTVQGPGTLRFYWKVSSETNYDYLRFYQDDVLNGAGISGTVDWAQRVLSVASGTHTLRWTYSKDYTVSSGSDAGWVDKIEYVNTLSVSKAGTGSGTVTSLPAGIASRRHVRRHSIAGSVTASAVADAGSAFSGLALRR
jgi:hypothetical protein